MSAPKHITTNMIDGPVHKLQPIRMADIKMSKMDSFDSLRSAVSTEDGVTVAAAPAPAKYVPPSKRGAAATAAAAAAAPLDVNSATAFPALGSTASPSPKMASWGQLRARLGAQAAPPAATQASNSSSLSSNPFAAISEDAPVASASPSSLNFKTMMKARIEKDEAEEAQREIPETEDPLEMTDQQLAADGWARLRLPPPGELEKWMRATLERDLARPAAAPSKDEVDPDIALAADPWTAMGIPDEIKNSGDSSRVLKYLCRYTQQEIGQEIDYSVRGSQQQGLLAAAAEPAKSAAAPTRFEQLLERKRVGLKKQLEIMAS